MRARGRDRGVRAGSPPRVGSSHHAAHAGGGRRPGPARVRPARPARPPAAPGGLEAAGAAPARARSVDGEGRPRPHRVLEGAHRPGDPGRAAATRDARPRREPDQPPRLRALAPPAAARGRRVAPPGPGRRPARAGRSPRRVVRPPGALPGLAPRPRRPLGGSPGEGHGGRAPPPTLHPRATRAIGVTSMLLVPDHFNRNSITVTSLMPPEQSGRWLLERMRQQIGFETYADVKLLDFGCGVRFSQAIINETLPIGRYVGVDCFAPMIDFLRSHVRDQRFAYYLLDAFHPLYNGRGTVLSPGTPLPVSERDFDVVSMFSVITHQNPRDSECIFTILRRHVARNGHLFFTCFLDDSIASFEDRSPELDGGRCFYNPIFLTGLVEGCGWRKVTQAPAEPPLIGDSFVYRPAG